MVDGMMSSTVNETEVQRKPVVNICVDDQFQGNRVVQLTDGPKTHYGKGDSMEPTINDGDAILFDSSDTRVRDGALYVIQVDGAANPEYYVKRAMVLDGLVYFASDNPAGDHDWRKPRRMESDRHPITVIGKVHWVGGWRE